MKRIIRVVLAVVFGMLVSAAYAQNEPEQQPKPGKKAATSVPRLEGTVRTVNKDTSTITVRSHNTDRAIVYTPETKFTKVNKPGGSLEDIKEGTRIIAIGKWDGNKLLADRIDIRLPK